MNRDTLEAMASGVDLPDLADLVGLPAWHAEARCTGQTDLMYDPKRVDAAKAICRRCPVSGPCLVAAIDWGEQWGVRGGMSPDERRHPGALKDRGLSSRLRGEPDR